MLYLSSSGLISLEVTKREAELASHPGPCDADVLALSRKPRIARQLAKLTPEDVRAELQPYGAWDESELADHQQNLQRLLWLACGDIAEGNA